MENRSKKIALSAVIAVTNGALLLLSTYFLWGWITISDIKSRSETLGYDFEKVLEFMMIEGAGTNSGNGGGVRSQILSPSDDPMFRRLRIGESLSIVRNGTNHLGQAVIEKLVVKVGYLDPFFRVSENVVNLVFTFGIGYIMSCVLVGLTLLRSKPISKAYLLLRPVTGAMVSVCLFVIVLSGGKILWEGGSHPNGLSVGIIAAIGSLYCDRFEKMLMKAIGSLKNPPQPEAPVS